MTPKGEKANYDSVGMEKLGNPIGEQESKSGFLYIRQPTATLTWDGGDILSKHLRKEGGDSQKKKNTRGGGKKKKLLLQKHQNKKKNLSDVSGATRAKILPQQHTWITEKQKVAGNGTYPKIAQGGSLTTGGASNKRFLKEGTLKGSTGRDPAESHLLMMVPGPYRTEKNGRTSRVGKNEDN